MRRTVLLIAALVAAIGLASQATARPPARAADPCPRGTSDIDYCQVGPIECTNGTGVIGHKDSIRCGAGRDSVTGEKSDAVARDCETVTYK